MRPPGSVSYPVQASGQLHDAKLVPQCAGPSPIREQPPGASAHPKDREALQSISGAEYQLSSLDFLKPKTHFVLHSVAESCYRSCCGARLHFPCAASFHLLFMTQWNPTPSVLGRDRRRTLPRNTHLSTGSI
ncbi:hypothetical protein NQZ68_001879 [Dissostichus eleginoides]|nr:hypothetical protein NQZ68_001879 [Dissostichus eleginoides]